MTAIVGYSNGKKIWLAGDSFIGDESNKNLCAEPKVYKIGKLAIGICGYVRQELILESVLKSVNPDDFSDEWLRFVFPDMLHDVMKSKGAIVEDSGQSTFGNSNYIFGLHGKLYYLENDFGIWESKKNVAAIGIGRQYCLGSLTTLSSTLIKYPEKALIKSLKVASEWSPYVTGPFNIISVE